MRRILLELEKKEEKDNKGRLKGYIEWHKPKEFILCNRFSIYSGPIGLRKNWNSRKSRFLKKAKFSSISPFSFSFSTPCNSTSFKLQRLKIKTLSLLTNTPLSLSLRLSFHRVYHYQPLALYLSIWFFFWGGWRVAVIGGNQPLIFDTLWIGFGESLKLWIIEQVGGLSVYHRWRTLLGTTRNRPMFHLPSTATTLRLQVQLSPWSTTLESPSIGPPKNRPFLKMDSPSE